jgi:hypothetical protein
VVGGAVGGAVVGGAVGGAVVGGAVGGAVVGGAVGSGVAVGQVGNGVGHRAAVTKLVGGAVVGGAVVGGAVVGGAVVGGAVVGGGQVGIGIGVPVGRVWVGKGLTAVARAGAPRTARASRPVISAVISALTAAMPAGRARRNAGRRRALLNAVSRFLIAFPSSSQQSRYVVLRAEIGGNAWNAPEMPLKPH